AIFPVESEENYSWFFQQVKRSQNMEQALDNKDAVFVSDRDKGLGAALLAEFPQAAHIKCLRHLKQNVKGGARKKGAAKIPALTMDDEVRVIKLGKAQSPLEFNTIMAELQHTNLAAAKYLADSEPRRWALYLLDAADVVFWG
ncbi:unnamed protein product, partial [Phaeothamnion confervicola]